MGSEHRCDCLNQPIVNATIVSKSIITASQPREPKGDLASSSGGLRDGDDGPHLLELRFHKQPPTPEGWPAPAPRDSELT